VSMVTRAECSQSGSVYLPMYYASSEALGFATAYHQRPRYVLVVPRTLDGRLSLFTNCREEVFSETQDTRAGALFRPGSRVFSSALFLELASY
jgi:hypothetical protein